MAITHHDGGSRQAPTAYERPSLRDYGDLGAMTAASGATTTEDGAGKALLVVDVSVVIGIGP